jgi:Ca2+-binding RTX toxin-like protein
LPSQRASGTIRIVTTGKSAIVAVPALLERLPRLRRSMALLTTVGLAALCLAATATTARAQKCEHYKATISGTTGDDRLRGTPGTDVIVGQTGDDRISGLDGIDVICGGGGNDIIRGGNMEDRILGGGGADAIREGEGYGDLLDTSPAGIYVYVEGGPGEDRLFGGGGADALMGQGGDDQLRGGAGHEREDRGLFGGGGDDRIYGGKGQDELKGAPGRDLLRYGPGRDGGEEGFDSGPGRDRAYGGAGNDEFCFTSISGRNDTYRGGSGNDHICVSASRSTSFGGGPGRDLFRLVGSRRAVSISLDDERNDDLGCPRGCDGNDVKSDIEELIVRAPSGLLTGSEGDDEIRVSRGEESARFTVIGLGGDDLLFGDGLGSDVIDAGAGNDRVLGGGGDDEIAGSTGDDDLRGEEGDDSLDGGDGVDRCDGGPDIDAAFACEELVSVP